jgi:hypothetical protein
MADKRHLHTGVQALQAKSFYVLERFGHCKGHKTDDDMVFMNIAWVEIACVAHTRCGGCLFEEFCIYASWILLLLSASVISWKRHLYCCA